MSTFFLVVKLMMPITKSDKKNRASYQQFTFKGFIDHRALKDAIFKHNPDMTADQRSFVEHDMEELNALVEGASTTSSIVGGMVQVVDPYDLAFIGKWRYDQRRLFAASVEPNARDDDLISHADDVTSQDIDMRSQNYDLDNPKPLSASVNDYK